MITKKRMSSMTAMDYASIHILCALITNPGRETNSSHDELCKQAAKLAFDVLAHSQSLAALIEKGENE